MQPIECADAIWPSSQKCMNFGLKKLAQNADTLTTITSILDLLDQHLQGVESNSLSTYQALQIIF